MNKKLIAKLFLSGVLIIGFNNISQTLAVSNSPVLDERLPHTSYASNNSTNQPVVLTNTASSSTRYYCDSVSRSCVANKYGNYSSLSECQANCRTNNTQPSTTRYSCDFTNGRCFADNNGGYGSLSSCRSYCVAPSSYDPDHPSCSGTNCQLPSSNTNCQIPQGCPSPTTTPPPPPPARYACNTSTWQCYASSSGCYTSLSRCQNECQAPTFDFSLSNSGDIVVYKPNSGSINVSNVIYANLISGNSQLVNFSQTGLPNGVSADSLSSCSPNCSRNNNLIIYSSAAIGNFPVIVTGFSEGISRTTSYNLIIKPNYLNPISVSCWASPSSTQVNQYVNFYSNVSGGSGNYYYSWSGVASGNSSTYSRSFSSSGYYTAYLTVTDSQSNSASASCSVNIEGATSPTLNFWADRYSLNQGESTYLRWTSENTNYCTASNGWSGNKSTYGYEIVYPNVNTTYDLICYGNNEQVSRSLTIYVSSFSGNNLNLTKLGRNLSSGERIYSKTIRVTKGEVIEFFLTVASGNKDLQNVVVKDILPSSLSYMAGTTKVDGVLQADTITTSGLVLGNLARGTTKNITFQALSNDSGYYLNFTNTAEATATGENKATDSVSITFSLVAGASTVKTGAEETFMISFIVSLISSVFLWYYFKFNSKGKIVFAGLENKIRERNLNSLRRKMIKK